MLSMSIRQVFARNLRLLRSKRGLSQEELSHASGVDRSYLSEIERELFSPTIDVVERLASSLGVSAFELLMPETPSGTAPSEEA